VAPLPPTPSGVIRVRLIHQVSEDTDAESSLHWAYSSGTPSQANLAALASAVGTSWSNNLRGQFASVVQLREVICIDLANPSNPPGIANPAVQANGGAAELTAETCVLVNLVIQRRYKGGHPRVYMPPPVAASLQDAQTWTTAFTSAFQTAWNGFVSTITAYAGPPTLTGLVNVSYYSGHTWHQNTATGNWKKVNTQRGTPLVDPITASVLNPKPGSQRRRMMR